MSSFNPVVTLDSHIADSALMVCFCCSVLARTFISFSLMLICSWPLSMLFVCFGCRCSALKWSAGLFAFSSHNWRLSPSFRKESRRAAWRWGFGFNNPSWIRILSPEGWPSPDSSTPPTSWPPGKSGLSHRHLFRAEYEKTWRNRKNTINTYFAGKRCSWQNLTAVSGTQISPQPELHADRWLALLLHKLGPPGWL